MNTAFDLPALIAALFDGTLEEKIPTSRHLFVERMKREGRGDEWKRAMDARANLGDRYHVAASKAMRDLGFVSKSDEQERFRCWLMEQSLLVKGVAEARVAEATIVAQTHEADGMRREAEAIRVEVKQEQAELRSERNEERLLVEAMPLANSPAENFLEDVRWVYRQFANVVRKTRTGEWEVVLHKATERAPSMGAVGMVNWGATNSTKLWELIFRTLGKIDQTDPEAIPEQYKDVGIRDLEQLRAELGKALE